jgi:hypothetical protein
VFSTATLKHNFKFSILSLKTCKTCFCQTLTITLNVLKSRMIMTMRTLEFFIRNLSKICTINTLNYKYIVYKMENFVRLVVKKAKGGIELLNRTKAWIMIKKKTSGMTFSRIGNGLELMMIVVICRNIKLNRSCMILPNILILRIC